MTNEELDLLFPPDHHGLTIVSDLRLLLRRLVQSDELGGIDFHEVLDIAARDAIPNPRQGDICKVSYNELGKPETYILNKNKVWRVLVTQLYTGGPGSDTIQVQEIHTVTSIDVAFDEYTLQKEPAPNEHIFVFLNGLCLLEGGSHEYMVVGNTIMFTDGVIFEGDILNVKYSYLP